MTKGSKNWKLCNDLNLSEFKDANGKWQQNWEKLGQKLELLKMKEYELEGLKLRVLQLQHSKKNNFKTTELISLSFPPRFQDVSQCSLYQPFMKFKMLK